MMMKNSYSEEDLFEKSEKVKPYKNEILLRCNKLYDNSIAIKKLKEKLYSLQKEISELESEQENEKSMIDSIMRNNSKIELELDDFKITYRISKSTHVTKNLNKIPDKYKTEVISTKVNKVRIKQDINEGIWNPPEDVAKVNINHNIQIKHLHDKSFK